MRITVKVQSSAINHICYDSETQVLKIAFKSNVGKEYDYPEVPLEEVLGFLEAESQGKYYHQRLKAYSVG